MAIKVKKPQEYAFLRAGLNNCDPNPFGS